MEQYHNFIGIDIGKSTFVIALHGQKESKEYSNDGLGINDFLKDYRSLLGESFCVLETTGGYELELLYTLCEKKIAVHRADTRKVKNFIRSYGNAAKTDNLDAKALAKYGFERVNELKLFKPQSKKAIELFVLVQRRSDLKKMLVAEKNRSHSAKVMLFKESCKQMISVLTEQLEHITQAIKELVSSDPVLKQKVKILKTVPGIGDITAFELIVLLPELGQLSRRKIASLAGVAPISNDSGKHQGYRRTGHGRSGIKPILFLSAMAARNSKSELKEFYNKLVENGKKKMVALTALMRKILVIANARIKEFEMGLQHS